MASNDLPWDQTPGYLAMSSRVVAPGGRTTYVVPRPVGFTPLDKTSFHPGQANWSKDNLSDIMYELLPSKAWKKFASSKLPPVQRDARGRPMEENDPEPGEEPRLLRAFDILPDRIGTFESPLLIEEWRRWDGRIRWQDITMRMSRPRPTHNILNMRAIRMRTNYCLVSWHAKAKHKDENAVRAAVFAQLTDQQIALNTTRGTTPGLENPSLGVAGGVVLHPSENPHSRGPSYNAIKKSAREARKAKQTVTELEDSDLETNEEDDQSSGQSTISETYHSEHAVKLEDEDESSKLDLTSDESLGNSQERRADTITSDEVPRMTAEKRKHTYMNESLIAQSAPDEPYLIGAQSYPQGWTGIIVDQYAANHGIHNQTPILDYHGPANELTTRITGSGSPNVYQGTQAAVESIVVGSNTSEVLPIDPSLPWDPSQEVDTDFWDNHFNSARTGTCQPAEPINAEFWLDPEYERAGWANFFATD